MPDKRNALIDVTRVAAAAGIILCHVDLTGSGAVDTLFRQFLSARFSLMFFLAVIGFYLEKSFLQGKSPVRKRVGALARVYGAWSLVYLVLSFVLLVVVQKTPLWQYLAGRVESFFLSGSYYHFWFYPAVIYALLLIGGVRRLLGGRALRLLLPLAVMLYAVGLFGTGYLPLGRQLPGLSALYALESFEAIMHLALLGFPSIVFGMAAAHGSKRRPGRTVLLAAAAYVAESVLLCLLLGWREDPQMLLTTPLLTVLYLQWAQHSALPTGKVNAPLLRTISAGMYNIHPLVLGAFAIVLPGMNALAAFLLCTACSALAGWMLYRWRNIRLISWFI